MHECIPCEHSNKHPCKQQFIALLGETALGSVLRRWFNQNILKNNYVLAIDNHVTMRYYHVMKRKGGNKNAVDLTGHRAGG